MITVILLTTWIYALLAVSGTVRLPRPVVSVIVRLHARAMSRLND